MAYVLIFLASGAVVVVAGTQLARHADAIAEATGLGRAWIGSVLLAVATSLPEIGTGVAAVRFGVPDLAAGNLFGSSMANMLILAIIGFLPGGRIRPRSAVDHTLAAALAILLNALGALFVVLRPGFVVGRISIGSAILFVTYLAGTRTTYRYFRRATPEQVEARDAAEYPVRLGRSAIGFGIAALVVLLAAPAFARSAEGVAALTGLGTTFIGTWLVGLATSLPELVTCIAAVRIGSLDLAIGNLFGSNAFNMATFLALDLAAPGSLFATLDPDHVVSALAGIVLMSLGLAAIAYRAERRFGMIQPDSLLVLVCYLLAIWVLYLHHGGV